MDEVQQLLKIACLLATFVAKVQQIIARRGRRG